MSENSVQDKQFYIGENLRNQSDFLLSVCQVERVTERETAKPATRKVRSRLCQNTVSDALKTGGWREAGLVLSAERKAGAESERRGEI